jgi:hypothetical protein
MAKPTIEYLLLMCAIYLYTKEVNLCYVVE